MKKFLSNTAFLSNNSESAFLLSNEAKTKQAMGEKVLNATLGMYLPEEKLPIENSTLYPVLCECLNTSSLEYASVDGGLEYEISIKKWTFDRFFEKIETLYHTRGLYTMGGTGALYLSFKNYVQGDQKILIPDLGWNNYFSIAKSLNINVEYYRFFDESNNFDLDSIVGKVKKSIQDFNRATLVINDPAHNPSGYSMTKNEWSYLINKLNELSDLGEIILILDVAYMDFANESRLFFEEITKTKTKFLTLVCFSASKAFGFYGLRMGGLICISEDKENADNFFLSSKGAIRTSWSVANHYCINVMNSIMKNNELIMKIKNDNEESKNIISKRVELTKRVLNFLGEPLPYKEGFFLTYRIDNAEEVCSSLTKKNIFCLPLQNKYIRVAVCSLTIKDLSRYL